MNLFLRTVAIGLFSISASLASAATIAPTASQFIIGNDGNPTGKANIAAWISSLNIFEAGFSVFEIEKVDSPSTSNGDMTVSYDGGAPSTSGSWSWSGSDAIEFVIYKGSNEFVAHYYNPGIMGNMWDTGALGILNNNGKAQAISHISLLGVDGRRIPPPPSTVPLPASGLMLIAAFGALVVGRRKRA